MPFNSGYVGVTEAPYKRRYSLRRSGTIPPLAKPEFLILFEGPREKYLTLKQILRPQKNIGWNKVVGGTASGPLKHGLAPLSGQHRKTFYRFWRVQPTRQDENRTLNCALASI
jgi:hypothetical protein